MKCPQCGKTKQNMKAKYCLPCSKKRARASSKKSRAMQPSANRLKLSHTAERQKRDSEMAKKGYANRETQQCWLGE